MNVSRYMASAMTAEERREKKKREEEDEEDEASSAGAFPKERGARTEPFSLVRSHGPVRTW